MYNIIWQGKQVGNARITKEGMFYRIFCKCSLPQNGTYKVFVTDGKNVCDLGICVPDVEGFACVARIACRKLCGNDFSFTLEDNKQTKGIPIATGRPFANLDKLNAARLHIANGQPEIIIDPIQGQQGSDLNPVHQNKSVQR